MYAGALTVAMARSKLDEHKLRDVELNEVEPGESFELGPFSLELVHMTHSIPDSSAVALGTDLGTVLITGDYKFDQTPVDGAPADVSRLAELGREGVLLLCGDSTNVDRPGFSPSESVVGPHLEEVFARCEGRIVVTSFASNIHRVQQVVDAAYALDRKVALVGRSMRKNVGIGRTLGHIEIPDGMLVGPREIADLADERVVIVSTGSQGEPLSALRRMAYRDHPQVELKSGDTVVFSATPVPGNERAVNETVDRLYHIGCDVITPREAPVHASGHGYAEEVKLMLNLVKPRYVMPFHGDFKRLRLHAQLAEAVGVPPRDIFQGDNGLPLEIDERGARFGAREQAGMTFVDGVEIGELADAALRDRRMLSADGIFIVVVTIAEQDGSSVADPEVIFRGVPFLDEADELIEEIRLTVERTLPARRARKSERSTCCSSCCTTTWRSWSMTGSSAGRWSCRSSSRSESAGIRTTKRAPVGPSREGSSATAPSCEAATAWTIASPRPKEPPRSPAPRTKRSNRPAPAPAGSRAVVFDDELHVAVGGR